MIVTIINHGMGIRINDTGGNPDELVLAGAVDRSKGGDRAWVQGKFLPGKEGRSIGRR